jgi:hypothetical protein
MGDKIRNYIFSMQVETGDGDYIAVESSVVHSTEGQTRKEIMEAIGRALDRAGFPEDATVE